MHDPMTVAFEIPSPFKDKSGYRNSMITIWHVDPCDDGTDDSCGWFLRPRHVDQEVLGKIKREFDFNFEHNYWFDKDGKQIFSTAGTLLNMYSAAAWIHFDCNRRLHDKFMRKHVYDIMKFAENPVDCAGDYITNKWKSESQEERFGSMAGMVYSDICRKERKWYQHPKWHVHHWHIQFVFIESLIRKFKNRNIKTRDMGSYNNRPSIRPRW